MAFDITAVLSAYQSRQSDEGPISALMRQAKYDNITDKLGIIGLGGTISSGYSFAEETIVPGPYKPAAVTLNKLDRSFSNREWAHTAIDLFAKDSRDITNDDMVLLLDFVRHAKNRYILITCGTYMLPRVAELLEQSSVISGKIIGLTGSMLPQGFTDSDAPANILSTLSAMHMAGRTLSEDGNIVIVGFHGRTYVGIDEFRKIDLHPEESKSTVLVMPEAAVPASR